ncbi:MAG: hypothetical protein AMXMBFR33_20500 [Candidatus Xenobia bacterium]
MSLLTARNLGKSHDGAWVFEGLSFAVEPDDRMSILGVSGSGKSTLLRLLAGLDAPSTGAMERSPSLRLGMVFQDLALWPNLTALDNVALALPGVAMKERRSTALASLSVCRVAELASRKPGTLSIGQQQRVALARAIVAQPQLLLLDEPFSSLDPLLRDELIREVGRVSDEIEAAVILVTHDVLEALSLTRRALVLEDGQLAESGELRSLLAEPRSRLLRHWTNELVNLERMGLRKPGAPKE